MERVVFIVEATDEQIPCLLNPESLVLQRVSGVEKRRLKNGLLASKTLTDDPIIFTGGGTTSLTVNLLFDVNLPEVPADCTDVRQLSGPLWQLSENSVGETDRKYPALMRFIWGKAFNFPGVIKEIAERLEYFTTDGTPQRSFVRLSIQRVAESADDLSGGAIAPPPLPEDLNIPAPGLGEDTLIHTMLGTDDVENSEGDNERLDQLAFDYFGAPEHWRLLAWLNDIENPLNCPAGTELSIASVEDVQP
jgi:hypothetical protein